MAKKKSDDEEEGKGGKGKMKPIIGGVLALGLVYKFVLVPKPSTEAASGVEAAKTAAHAEGEPIEGEIVAVSELVVNLQAEDGNLHYLRVGLALILAKGANAEVMKEETAIASDAAIELLGEKTFEEALDPAEKKNVRDELSELVVERYGAKKVQGILFTTFVMQ